jgi:legumain
MMIIIKLAIILNTVCSAEITDHWALLVAGSSGFVNYRHQADVCHAYHLLLDQGIPENQIITMAFDDIVWDDENPVPGKLFNKQDGQDVYEGCKLDYSGKDVHAQNFIAIMKGDQESLNITEGSNSTQRVLKSD